MFGDRDPYTEISAREIVHEFYQACSRANLLREEFILYTTGFGSQLRAEIRIATFLFGIILAKAQGLKAPFRVGEKVVVRNLSSRYVYSTDRGCTNIRLEIGQVFEVAYVWYWENQWMIQLKLPVSPYTSVVPFALYPASFFRQIEPSSLLQRLK